MIILLLIAAIMFIIARNKRSRRSDVLNSLQHNFNQDTLGLGIDKRGNSHMKVIHLHICFWILFFLDCCVTRIDCINGIGLVFVQHFLSDASNLFACDRQYCTHRCTLETISWESIANADDELELMRQSRQQTKKKHVIAKYMQMHAHHVNRRCISTVQLSSSVSAKSTIR